MKRPAKPKPKPKRKRNPDRIKRQVAAFFAPEISRGLKLLAAETDTTVQALMAEALSDLFAKRGKYQLAEALRPAETTEGHADFSTGMRDD
jgi:predicted transcriptional regulator